MIRPAVYRTVAVPVAAAMLLLTTPVAAAADTPPLRILAIGDSITAAGQWQTALALQLDAAHIPHIIETEALGGSRCNHWPSLMPGILAKHQPDLVYLYCGTNDDPNETAYGEPATAWAFRSIVEQVHGYRPAHPALVVPALIGYSDGTQAPDWLWVTNEPRTNDILWSQMVRYLPPNSSGWFAGIANLQLMPGTAEYIGGDTCNPAVSTCGVHPNDKGYRTVGRLMYDAAAPGMGWPASQDPPLCGMSGHRKGGMRPAYTPCPN